jgi:hypothetical protein
VEPDPDRPDGRGDSITAAAHQARFRVERRNARLPHTHTWNTWDRTGTPGARAIVVSQLFSGKRLLKQEQTVSARFSPRGLAGVETTFQPVFQVPITGLNTAAAGNHYQRVIPGQGVPLFVRQQPEPEDLSQAAADTVALNRAFVDFFTDDKPDAGLRPFLGNAAGC